MAKRQRDRAKEQQWRRLIAEWRRSQLNIRVFCLQRQLSEASFHAWRRTLAERVVILAQNGPTSSSNPDPPGEDRGFPRPRCLPYLPWSRSLPFLPFLAFIDSRKR